jgi:hypothetical protein
MFKTDDSINFFFFANHLCNNNATMVKAENKVIAGVHNYLEIHMFEGHGHLIHPGAT